MCRFKINSVIQTITVGINIVIIRDSSLFMTRGGVVLMENHWPKN